MINRDKSTFTWGYMPIAFNNIIFCYSIPAQFHTFWRMFMNAVAAYQNNFTSLTNGFYPKKKAFCPQKSSTKKIRSHTCCFHCKKCGKSPPTASICCCNLTRLTHIWTNTVWVNVPTETGSCQERLTFPIHHMVWTTSEARKKPKTYQGNR